MRTVARIVWCDDEQYGYRQAPHGDILALRCEIYLDDGQVARVAVLGKAVAAITASYGCAVSTKDLRKAAQEFYLSRLDSTALNSDPAHWFEYNESVDGILALLPRG